MKRILALTASALFTGVASLAIGVAPAQAAGTTIVGQAAYTCQFVSPGIPPGTDTVTVQLKLNVPASVQPGTNLKLYGSLTMQFSEELRQVAKSIGTNSVDGYTDNFSAQLTAGGASSRIVASRVQSPPTVVGDPMLVTMPISYPAYTVPAKASGAVQIQLPQNGNVPNSVTNSPAQVAFSAVARTSGPGGETSVKFACFLPPSTPAVVGSVPIGAAAAAPSPAATTNKGGGAKAAPAAGAPAAATPAGAATPAAPAAPTAPVADGTAAVDASAAAGSAATSTAAGAAAAETPAVLQAVSAEPRGVYVPTGLLVVGGFLVCLLALGYAALTNIRLRALRDSVDG